MGNVFFIYTLARLTFCTNNSEKTGDDVINILNSEDLKNPKPDVVCYEQTICENCLVFIVPNEESFRIVRLTDTQHSHPL